jgi:hypothetical protein
MVYDFVDNINWFIKCQIAGSSEQCIKYFEFHIGRGISLPVERLSVSALGS